MAGSLVLLHFFDVSFVPTALEMTCRLGRNCTLFLERVKIGGDAECLRVIKTHWIVSTAGMPAPLAITDFLVHGLSFEHNAIICSSAKQHKPCEAVSPGIGWRRYLTFEGEVGQGQSSSLSLSFS
jgi:hypothetical protein